ncbi:MAG: short chain dehydrogenase [Deltaproteobacteria bacterium]|jgi:3-oxoacyl-[acyl-carrier protein] reductase|nr:short chain dehydrogenase [Deltaproteobacteria bacterium]
MADRPPKQTPPPYVPGHDLLKGKTVLMTAAAGAGIGFATAQRCAEEGARLFISDIHEKRTAEAAKKLAEFSAEPVGYRLCNVRDDDDVRSLVAAAIEEMGRVDVVINNAGLGGETPVVEMTDDQWTSVLDITLNSAFRMTRAVLPHMIERKSGVIVNNASVLGWRAQKGQAHYAAAKAGVMALTRCSALEAAEHGIRINAVSPSIAIHPFLVKTTPRELIDELEAKEAFGRGAAPWEVANVIVFLASDYSSYMTGEVVSVSSQRS